MSSEPGVLKDSEKSEKLSQFPDDFGEKLDSGSFGAADGDEALQLVGVEAKEHFSDEFNRKLRRKLVRKFGALQMSVVGWLSTIYILILGLCHPDDICSSLFYSISVRLPSDFLTSERLTCLRPATRLL